MEGTLSVYEGKIYLLMPVKVGAEAKAGTGEIELGLLTQACDDKNCLPPKTLTLKVPYRIGTAGDAQAARDEKLVAAAEAQAYAPDMPAAPAEVVATSPVAAARGAGGGGGGTVSGDGDLAGVHLLTSEEQVALINARPYKAANSQELNYPLWAIVLLALAGGGDFECDALRAAGDTVEGVVAGAAGAWGSEIGGDAWADVFRGGGDAVCDFGDCVADVWVVLWAAVSVAGVFDCDDIFCGGIGAVDGGGLDD